MIFGGVISLLQLNAMRERAEYLYEADQPARAVLRVRSSFLSYQNDLRRLSSLQDAARFEIESQGLLKAFQADVDHAVQALRSLPAGTQRDSELSSLETVNSIFTEQVESLIALAHAGDWVGVRLRVENRMPVINDLSASLVHDIDAIVEIEKKNGLEEIRSTQVRAVWTLAVTGLLTLMTAGFLGLRVTRSIAGRLEILDTAARALTRGDFEHQAAVKGDDEISRLSEVFNEMASRLRALYEVMHRSEAHFRALIENASDFIVVLNAEGIIQYVSPSMERQFASDTPSKDALSKNGSLVGQNLHALAESRDAEAVRELLTPAAESERSRGPLEFRLRGKDGSLRVLEAYASNLLQDPAVAGFVLNARDITDRKHMEQQLYQAQRMEAIGTLSGGVAHDFNNLLTVIRGYTNHLIESPEVVPEVRTQIKRVDQAAERAATLTRQLLAFSRRTVLEPKTFDLNALVANLDHMLRRLISEDIAISTATDAKSPTVNADPGQIEQVILNLVINARDAMPHGGKLTLETANVELDAAYTAKHTGAVPGRYVMLAISDTGEGMDLETQGRIFEPFFTTKGVGKGTGLGLSMVYGIVKQSEGHIWVYSERGQGSTFKVYLPWVDAAVDTPEKEEQPVPVVRGQETILVVEDEPQIRELIKILLSGYGYSVICVDDPLRAVTVSKQHDGPIHLLLTDVVLPGISGRQVAEQIAAHRPETKILFTSGYTTNAIVHHGVLDAGLHFLQKPFTMKTLATKVREVLDWKNQGGSQIQSGTN